MSICIVPAPEPKRRRIKRLTIQADMLLHMLRGQDGTRLLKTTDIPEGARVIGLTVGQIYNTVSLYIESEEFEETHESQCWPDLDVTFTSYHPELIEPDKLLFTVGADVVRVIHERIEKTMKGLANGSTG